VAHRAIAYGREAQEPSIIVILMAGAAVLDVIILNMGFMHERNGLGRIRLHDIAAGCFG